MSDEVYHIPALLQPTLEALEIKPGGVYVDATFGGGGHSRAILEKLAPEGHLYSFDQDEDAVHRAWSDPRFTIVYSNFRFLSNFMRFYGVKRVDGILADLGVSFHHFDDSSRGFSFRWTGPLDMRMNQRATQSAATFLAEATEEKIAATLRVYGEVKLARRMASAIVRARADAPVDTVERLLDIIKPMINQRAEKKELAMVFQALRIEVNGELDALRAFLTQSASLLSDSGRLAIITYHSLEDRIVKNFMRAGNFGGEVEKDFYGRTNSPLKLLASKPIVPDGEEVEANPRSRSAKLRVACRNLDYTSV